MGHAQEKFTTQTEAFARTAIQEEIARFQPELIISGHSPMGGVDIYAEQIAQELGIQTRIFAPRQHSWHGTYGYKARNLDIAKESDVVLCVVVRELPPDFKGMSFSGCYHCGTRNALHVKSGGCWTAWKAKRGLWRIIVGD